MSDCTLLCPYTATDEPCRFCKPGINEELLHRIRVAYFMISGPLLDGQTYEDQMNSVEKYLNQILDDFG